MAIRGGWTREATRRFTRRRVLGATALGGTAAFLAACGGDEESDGSAQQIELDTTRCQLLVKEIMARDLDQAYRVFTLNGYKIQVRPPYVYNATDQVHAWGPYGWGRR